MKIKLDIFNLWLWFVIGYGTVWIFMLWANKRRGKPIEDVENYLDYNRKHKTWFGFLPAVLVFLCSFLVPVKFGLIFWIGLIVFTTGIVINIFSMISFANSKDGLNTTGIYQYSRNPMYVGMFLFVLGLNLMGWAISIVYFPFLVLSVFWIGTIHWHVRQEEKFLLKKYGDSFSEYALKVPRYLGVLKPDARR